MSRTTQPFTVAVVTALMMVTAAGLALLPAVPDWLNDNACTPTSGGSRQSAQAEHGASPTWHQEPSIWPLGAKCTYRPGGHTTIRGPWQGFRWIAAGLLAGAVVILCLGMVAATRRRPSPPHSLPA